MEVVYYVAASLDGYIAARDGGVDWLSPFEGPEVSDAYSRFYRSVDALVMGRRTYEQVVASGEWPYKGKPCWVFSRRPLEVLREGVTAATKSPSQVLPELRRRRIHRIWLVGGSQLATSFRKAGLITEYVVTVVPVILGMGIPLFAPTDRSERLRLVASKPYANGLVELRYLRDQKKQTSRA